MIFFTDRNSYLSTFLHTLGNTMAFKLTPEQQRETWLNLQKKAKSFSFDKDVPETKKVLILKTQAEKNKALKSAIDDGNTELFISIAKMGGTTFLDEVFKSGENDIIEEALRQKFPIKNINKIWDHAENSGEIATLFLDHNIPYDDHIILKVWDGFFNDYGMTYQSVEDWFNHGGRLVPDLVKSKARKKLFLEQLGETLNHFTENESQHFFYRFLQTMFEHSQITTFKPFEEISFTDDSNNFWQAILEAENSFPLAKMALKFGIFPEKEIEIQLSNRGLLNYESCNLGLAGMAFVHENKELFDFLMEDSTQEELFSENLKKYQNKLLFNGCALFESKHIEYFLNREIDFTTRNKSKNSLFHQIFHYIEDESKKSNKSQPFIVSQTVWDLLIDNSSFIFKTKNKNKNDPLDLLSRDVKIKTPDGIFTKASLRSQMEKRSLDKSLKPAKNISHRVQRL